MTASRHTGRVIVLQALFEHEFQVREPAAALQHILEEYEGKISDTSFACALFESTISHLKEIREQIVSHAPQWPIEKIAPIDRAILEIAVCEMLFSTDVPAVVAIDEAIELAKSFGNENSKKFVNGVLNTIHKERTDKGTRA